MKVKEVIIYLKEVPGLVKYNNVIVDVNSDAIAIDMGFFGKFYYPKEKIDQVRIIP